MSDFLIDTPNHKRWWLPCRCHQYNSFIYGDTESITIIDPVRGETVTSADIKLMGDWEALSELTQELAKKNHPAPIGRMNRCKIVPGGVQLNARRDYAASRRR